MSFISRAACLRSLGLLLIMFAVAGSFSRARADSYVIRFSAPIGNRADVTSRSALLFKKEVEEKSGGRITVQMFFGSQLGTLQAVADQVRDGTIEMNGVGFGFLAKYFPDVQAFTLPFIFKNETDAHATLDGPLGDELKKAVLEHIGVRILGIGEFGFKNIFNNRRDVETLADLKGLKIRVLPSPIAIATFNVLGAIPVSMDYAETYTAIQRGAIDGAEQSYSTIYDNKFYEVAKHISETDHFFEAMCFNINEKFYQSLPTDLRSVVAQAAIDAQNSNREMTEREDQHAKAELKAKGVTIDELTPEALAAFHAAVAPIYTEAKSKFAFGPDGTRWVDRLTKPR